MDLDSYFHPWMNGFQFMATLWISFYIFSTPALVFGESDLLGIRPLNSFNFLHRRNTRGNGHGIHNNPTNSNNHWFPVPHPQYRQNSMNSPTSRMIPPSQFDTAQSRASTMRIQRVVPPLPSFTSPPPHSLQIRPSQPEHHQRPSPSFQSQISLPKPTNPSIPQQYLPTLEPSSPTTGTDESELRFLFHRPEDENLIKSTILEESKMYNEKVSFLPGPALKFQRKQTIYLPPRKKSVIYILMKEPQVQTDLEVIESQPDPPPPEVNIIYENPGGVQTKHYYTMYDGNDSNSEHTDGSHQRVTRYKLKEDKSLEQPLTGSGSELKDVKIPFQPTTVTTRTLSTSKPRVTRLSARSVPTDSNPCQPQFKKMRK